MENRRCRGAEVTPSTPPPTDPIRISHWSPRGLRTQGVCHPTLVPVEWNKSVDGDECLGVVEVPKDEPQVSIGELHVEVPLSRVEPRH